MDMLIWLREIALAQSVGPAPTLRAYPTILTLHTAGMSVVVGTCAVIDLRILDVAGDVPFTSLRRPPLFVLDYLDVNGNAEDTNFRCFPSEAPADGSADEDPRASKATVLHVHQGTRLTFRPISPVYQLTRSTVH